MGAALVLLSAVGFGLMAIFAKLAYAEGVDVGGLLVVRFGTAGTLLLAVAAATGALGRLQWRSVVAAVSMGVVGYAAQAGLYLAAVARTDASEVALVFCVYPLLVMAAAVAIGRERSSRRRLVAVALALGGSVLVFGGMQQGAGSGGDAGAGFDGISALLALGSAVVYTAYILVGDKVVRDVPAVPLAALVCIGAFASCTTVALLTGGPGLPTTPAGWGWVFVIAGACTVAAILLFFGGLARVGPSVAALLSGIEPVVTVGAAAVVFGEVLTTRQALGGALVVLAVVLVQEWARGPRPAVAGPGRDGASAGLSSSPPAGVP